MNQATRGGRMSESAVRTLYVAMHKGECASGVLNAIVIGRALAKDTDFDSEMALESLPHICVHTLAVTLSLLDNAYSKLDMSDDDILATIPTQVAFYLGGER